MNDSERLRLMGTDARKWTDEFVRIKQSREQEGLSNDDAGWLTTWFANAIQAGYDAILATAAQLAGMSEDDYLNTIVGAGMLLGRLSFGNIITSVEPVYVDGIVTNSMIVKFPNSPVKGPAERGYLVTVSIPHPERNVVPLEDVSIGLIDKLQELFDNYGPLGVERTVIAMRRRLEEEPS